MNKIIFPLKTRMRGAAVTDLQDALRQLVEQGWLRLSDDERKHAERFGEERAKGTFGKTTRKLVELLQKQQQLPDSGEVDEATAAALNRLLTRDEKPPTAPAAYLIKGTVRRADGAPARGVLVRAYDRDLRAEELLGERVTDGQGAYEIRYEAAQFQQREKDSADLVVKVGDVAKPLAASAVLFNAPPVAEINLTLPAEVLSEFERIARALAPLLRGVALVELEEDEQFQDISFLAGETGFAAERLVWFALSHRLAAESRIEAEFWYALLATRFAPAVGRDSLRVQLAAALAALPGLDAAAVSRALAAAANQNLIPAVEPKQSAAWTEAFLAFVARRALGGEQSTALKAVLEDAGVKSAKKQERFARLFADERGFTPALVEALKKDEGFKPAEITDLQTTFRLADVMQGDVAAARVVKKGFALRRPEQVRQLAKTEEDEWVALVRKEVAAGALRLPIEIPAADMPKGFALRPTEAYGKLLAQRFHTAFPTTAFAGGLERALQNGGARGVKRPELVGRFLNEHESFELLHTSVDEFLREHDEELARDDNFRLELKGIQRVFKLAPSYAAADVLLADEVHSAQQVYRMGETEFVRRYAEQPGFTAKTARLAWQRAAETHAATLTIVGELQALQGEGLPQALQNDNAALANFPNWNNLFQTGDLCECEHCRSVLSPAAYFADLLMFLKERRAKNPARTVKEILFDRRPDLGYLELNCENALTPLPYIDVVCEVLEDVIADGDNDRELIGLVAIPDTSAATRTAVAGALAAAGLSLGTEFTLSQIGASNRWVVHGSEATYLLKLKATLNYFAEILRNTKASAAELRANPQYVNPAAYDKLKTARYPFGLPFDLFAEEVRAAFQKIAVKRWELMNTLHGVAAPNNASDGDSAAEYFGIAVDAAAVPVDEKRIILTAAANAADQQIYWDEAALPGNLANVKIFLQKTGLEFNELLTLLDLEFINPAGDIGVQRPEPSCDTDKMILQVLDAAKLDRIHRFLRLWRKLKGWKMWELDWLIRHSAIGAGNLDEAFLFNLMQFVEVKNRLGAKVTLEQTAALFGDLNTTTRFTKLYDKREDALYQNLFLNRRLIQPLDAAFQLDPGMGDLPAGQTITAHQSVVQAALGVSEAALLVFKNLKKASDGLAYINDDLNLANLSFLYRHAWLAKTLKFKAEEWAVVLKLYDQDLAAFANPSAAAEFLERSARLKSTGLTVDELNWLLAADRTAKAAVKETDASKFLFGLRKALQAVRATYDAAQYDFLSSPTDETQLEGLLSVLLQTLQRDEAAANFFLATVRGDVVAVADVTGLPANFVFPAALNLPIHYDEAAQVLRFTGVMTAAQRTTLLTDASLAAVTGIVAYQEAIAALFQQPRLAVKFYELVFTTPLDVLPAAVDFKAAGLDARISYDAEQRLLRCNGLMTVAERTALDALVPNVTAEEIAYHNAIADLAAQPLTIVPPDARVWLTDNDLDASVATNDTYAKRLATAITRALAYLAKTLADNTVVEQTSERLGLTQAVTRALLTRYAMAGPDAPLAFFTGAFATTSAAIDYAGFKTAFDTWYWLNRVAALLKKWKVNLEELAALITLQAPAQLLDFAALPLDDAAGAVAPLAEFLRTAQLLKLRDTLPETGAMLLAVLVKLDGGAYAAAADFAADVERLNENWRAADVETLTQKLDLAYPADFLLAESWERMRLAFTLLDKLNCTADTALGFAQATMSESDGKTLKQLLRAKFGTETWLTLSTEIQDVLRERKRDALVAWLLHQHTPAPAPPSGKWENTNDVYAYYLLDVEMSACQLTSRLVQGSGSIQLFVQRCHMGLEPDVVVQAGGDDGDSAWRWWKWMRKYRVWEANRKVFLYPENWIEPELRRDKSSFFSDLENELLQNEVNQPNVETAFLNYLEKLEGVAQLEIAGFFHEDDADQTILHVFGRTKGGEPHLYYYRQFDYRRWTPWEKVELDIVGDYLIPAVINKRMFLFWPVFTEVPDEKANKNVKTPNLNSNIDMPDSHKRLQLQMAFSEYRQGKWTPKKVSTDRFETTVPHIGEIIKNQYKFWPVDRTHVDGRFGIRFEGTSQPKFPLYSGDTQRAYVNGAFELVGCKGVPELTDLRGDFEHVLVPEQAGNTTLYARWNELPVRTDSPENDFTLMNRSAFVLGNLPDRLEEWFQRLPILMQTPNLFKMSPPWHLSYLDKFWLDTPFQFALKDRQVFLTGSWLPYFYADKKRTFFVLPALTTGSNERGNLAVGLVRYYYPDIKRFFRAVEDFFEGQVRTFVEAAVPTLSAAERQNWEAFFRLQFPFEENQPPYTDEKFIELAVRFWMRYFNFWLGYLSLWLFQFRQFHFKHYYHPFVCDFAKLVYNPLKGIPALMRRETQLKDSGFRFKQIYQPTPWVVYPTTEEFYPREDVDFTPDGAYSPYNWELFFHAPLMIANQLSRNQRFEEAREWYHFIFNPIGVESTTPGGSPLSKYWITKPFYETTDAQYVQQRIDTILHLLAGDTTAPGFTAQLRKDLEDQVRDWRDNPFEPHRIALYRKVAYQKTTVMKYLDNLIAWGDALFRQDSMESINEATQLYILAAEILGPRPRKIPPRVKPPVESFNELEDAFDRFSNALVQVENLVPPQPGNAPDDGDAVPLPQLSTLYFCIPHNEKLLGYWDTVADRLYKIRHCMNIEGVVRQLALFEPPIDPAALVKAVAGGVDISSALADMNAPLPLYRFNVLLQKANEVCADVKALGGALLAALEKKDAEALGLLRQRHEINLLTAVKAVREQQIEEAKENLEGLRRSQATIEERRNYYRDIEQLSSQEKLHLDKLALAHTFQEAAQGVKLAASIISIFPAIDLGVTGFGGSPVAKFKLGGLELGQAADLAAEVLSFHSSMASNDAAMASVRGGFDRRWNDWKLQERLADKELVQMDSQIAAAELRIAIAEKELDNHLLQIEQAKATDEFMRTKYTNLELYQWQIGQISGVYFQSYKLAYDLAKRAERCFRYELGLADSSFINFGYWDSLKKGLLSGEKLQYDLRRLETAYLEQNRREYELTKHVSLALLDPLALVKLRETGRCFLRIPEELFDLDYPGHYFRRLKSVSLTLPCVAGPYTTVACTLRLTKNSVRINTAQGDNGYARNTDEAGAPADDARFVENNLPVKAIAASSAQNDSGVFELSFRDERYLPFEGAGAISEWALELFSDLPANNPDPGNPDFGKPLRQFDYSTITDAVLHLKYTAREDAGLFKNGAIAHLRDYFELDDGTPAFRLIDLRRDFPSQWHRFLHPVNAADGNVFELEMDYRLFPYRDQGKTLKLNRVTVLARCADAADYTVTLQTHLDPPADAVAFTLASVNEYGGLHFAAQNTAALDLHLASPLPPLPPDPPIKWRVVMERPGGGNLQIDAATNEMEVADVLLVVGYEWN